jgi:hypothetical protein
MGSFFGENKLIFVSKSLHLYFSFTDTLTNTGVGFCTDLSFVIEFYTILYESVNRKEHSLVLILFYVSVLNKSAPCILFIDTVKI